MTIPSFTLNDGWELPAITLGTARVRGGAAVNQFQIAINDGYRSIDSSTSYEGAVGEAIRRSGVPRAELVVTSKLPGKYHRYADATTAIQESLYRMGLDYFDLFLIHWPLPKQDLYVEAWQAMIDAQKRGLIRSIGVSNFEPEHLDRIIQETGVTPSVNQIEVHPYWNQERMVTANRERGILTEAWSPLGRGSSVIKEPLIQSLAAKYHKNVVQIILRWHHQRGIVPLPRTHNIAHQRTNLDIFDFQLTDDEMAQIAALTKVEGRVVAGQDPNVYEEFE